MRRRARSEIQHSGQVPSYDHNSLVTPCTDTGYLDRSRIYYNAEYEYSINSITVYDRDNYCIIPLAVSPMTLSGSPIALDNSVVITHIPKVSTRFGLEYNYEILTEGFINLDVVSSRASADTGLSPDTSLFAQSLNRSHCSCDNPDDGGDPWDAPELCMASSLCGPIDRVVVLTSDISDEYAYNWQDNWDMATLVSRSRSRKDHDDSSSTSSSPGSGTIVFLGRISGSPMGSGGTVSVSGIKVSGSGGISSGNGSAVVNVPSI